MEKKRCIFRNMIEQWKDIEGYEGLYQVSNYGNVRSMDHKVKSISWQTGKQCYRIFPGRVLKPVLKRLKYGVCYYIVGLSKESKKRHCYVHRLVAEAFIPNPTGLPQVNHKDENGLNNNVSNLEWCSVKYNINYGNHNEKVKISNSKWPILQFSADGTFIKEWISQKEIERVLGMDQTHISKCVINNKKCCGYFFKRKETN